MYPQQPPPQPFGAPPPTKGVGCLGFVLIALGVGALGTLALCGLVVTTSKTSPEEKRRLDDELAAVQAAASAENARRTAKFEAEVRTGCKLKPDAAVFVPADDDAQREHCRALIRDALKVPGSADFPNRSDEGPFVSDDGCNRIYRSHVDAQNAFGVKVRTKFDCTLDPRTGVYSTKTSN